jgi:hypothetical protein
MRWTGEDSAVRFTVVQTLQNVMYDAALVRQGATTELAGTGVDESGVAGSLNPR